MEEHPDELIDGWFDDYTAVHEVKPYMLRNMEVCERDRELMITRVKLECRTFWMRVAIGLFAGSWAGFLVALATEKIQITP